MQSVVGVTLQNKSRGRSALVQSVQGDILGGGGGGGGGHFEWERGYNNLSVRDPPPQLA